jgi:hypothetical protein
MQEDLSMNQVIEHLPKKQEALSSIPRTAKKRQKNEEGGEGGGGEGRRAGDEEEEETI